MPTWPSPQLEFHPTHGQRAFQMSSAMTVLLRFLHLSFVDKS